jgi:hypothetical protein
MKTVSCQTNPDSGELAGRRRRIRFRLAPAAANQGQANVLDFGHGHEGHLLLSFDCTQVCEIIEKLYFKVKKAEFFQVVTPILLNQIGFIDSRVKHFVAPRWIRILIL